MTQDQYGQAQDAGYGNGGDVAEDDDQNKPMTRFQKVASALRGDRTDRDEDEANANQADAVSPVAAGTGPAGGPDLATDSNVAAAGDPSWVTHPNDNATTAGTQQGDYWEVPDAREDQVVVMTSPATPVTDTSVDPLARQETVEQTRPDLPDSQTPIVTQAGEYETGPGGATAADTAAGDTAGSAVAGSPGADTRAGNTADADTLGGNTAGTDTLGADTLSGNTAGTDTLGTDTLGGNTAGTDTLAEDGGVDTADQAGAATISDGPVTQGTNGAAGTEAGGRHAATAQAEDLRPGEATGTLDDLSDLAYGNLLPDASHFTEQWQQIQFRFVDDPQASVTEAAEVVAEVTAKLEAAIQERQRAIAARQQAIQERQRSLRGRWGEGTQADTETLRETLRMYRAFLDQLIGPKA